MGPEYATALADPFNSTASPPTSVADASQDVQLAVNMPKAVAPGESASVTLEVVSIKSKAGGSPVEFNIDPLPASVSAAGMTPTTLCGSSTIQCVLWPQEARSCAGDETTAVICHCVTAKTGAEP